MTTRTTKLTRIALLLGLAGIAPVQGAQAALLNVIQTFPDITLTSVPYLIYDHNGVNATTGQLRVFSGSSTLNEGAAAGGTNDTQSYFGPGDSIPNLDLTINVNNTTGAFVSGTVTIGFGNAAAEPQYSWTGNITNFGFANVASGRVFDATWTVTSDLYQQMPANLSQFVNGYLTGGSGGLIISNSKGFGVAATCTGTGCVAGTPGFANDWILGAAAQTNSNLDTGGLTSPLKINSTVTSDVFATPVPEASTYGMMLVGLAMLAPLVRRKKLTK